MKKKNILVILGILFFCSFGFSQGTDNFLVWVMPTEGKNLGKDEAHWLPDVVHKKLHGNFTNYTNLTVTEDDPEKLAKIQDITYNENIKTAVRQGKQSGVAYVIRSTITKAGSVYNLNVIFQDLETGKYFAESNTSSKDIDNLYINPGCAVNEATIEICNILDKDFGTRLSYYNEKILRYGLNNLSQEDEKKYIDEEEKRINENIKKLDKEIQSASISKDADAEIKKIQYQLRKTQEEERLKQIQQRKERIAQDEANKAAEEEAKQIRSEAQKKRIAEAEKTLTKKVETLRTKNFSTASVLTQIGVIEAKKKAILEIREKRTEDVNKITQEYNTEIEKKRSEIMDAPLHKAEKDSTGAMLPEVEADRKKRAKEEEKKIRSEYENHVNEIKKISLEAENSLSSQIEEHKKEIQKPKTADNIVKRNLTLDVIRFAGEKKSWSARATLVLDGKNLYSKMIDIDYKSLTGKEPNVLSDEYKSEVDLYDSLFSKNLSPVIAEMTYYFTAAPDNKPSVYLLHIDTIKLTHTENGKKIKDIKINEEVEKQFVPVYDIRPDDVKNKLEQKALQEQQKRQEKEKAQSNNGSSKSTRSCNDNKDDLSAYLFFGPNIPILLPEEIDKTLLPFGLAFQIVGEGSGWTYKTNFSLDFINYSDNDKKPVNGFFGLSLGGAPIHNDDHFLGLYVTMGIDKIEDYEYFGLGVSGTYVYTFSNHFGIYANIDATQRDDGEYKGKKEIPPYLPRYADTWRIMASVGLSFNLWYLPIY